MLCSSLLTAAPASHAQDYKDLDARYSFTSKSFYDLPACAKKDRFNIEFTGSSAKEIFDAMPGRTKREQCSSDGQIKTAGGLECINYKDGDYRCAVSILLRTGVLRGRRCVDGLTAPCHTS